MFSHLISSTIKQYKDGKGRVVSRKQWRNGLRLVSLALTDQERLVDRPSRLFSTKLRIIFQFFGHGGLLQMKQTDMWDVPTGWDSAVSLHILHSITTLYTFYKTFRERKYLPDDFTKLVN